jgi:hypothetical protein
VDFRDFVSNQGTAEFKLFPYSKDMYYRADGMLVMTLEIYNNERSEQFEFGFMCSPQLRRFLNRTLGDEVERED